MTIQNVTLALPEELYIRFQQTAQATRQSLAPILLTRGVSAAHRARRTRQCPSKVSWLSPPPAHNALWRIAERRGQQQNCPSPRS